MRTRLWLAPSAPFAALVAIGFLGVFAGCAASVKSDIDDETSEIGGDGGGGSGGSDPAACAMDCSAIDTPPCLTGVCNAASGQCEVVPSPKGEACDDGLFCTAFDSCNEGKCEGGVTNTCGMTADICLDIECHEASKSCSFIPVPNGLVCTIPGDLCVVNATCQSGACKGVQKDCFFAPVPDACHVATCNADTGKCEPMPGNDGQACPNDGDLCMVNKTCAAGVCQGGQPKDCSALTNGCNNGVCEPVSGSCVGDPIPPGGMCLEATNECNTGICDNNGSCNPVPTPGVQCASGTDACHVGTCDANGACVAAPANDGAACDDGNMCTLGETCLAGACQGGMVGNYVVYFSETFASNAAGWTLGPEWQIGPAVASNGIGTGFDDPAQDHTPTADNGIAGVVIGGYASTSLHPQAYLTSPPFNADVMGPVYLEFWRVLNSDYVPYMQNTVDVFDGAAWVNVWSSGGPPQVSDADWTHLSYDLTAYKNPAMQIRFGFDVTSGGVFTVSGWNVDDIVVANAVCN